MKNYHTLLFVLISTTFFLSTISFSQTINYQTDEMHRIKSAKSSNQLTKIMRAHSHGPEISNQVKARPLGTQSRLKSYIAEGYNGDDFSLFMHGDFSWSGERHQDNLTESLIRELAYYPGQSLYDEDREDYEVFADTAFIYMEEPNDFDPDVRRHYTQVDENSRIIEYMYAEQYDGNWENEILREYTYIQTGDIDQIRVSSKTSNSWKPMGLIEHEYDADGNLILEEYFEVTDSWKKAGDLGRIEYEYDSEAQLISQTESWIYNPGEVSQERFLWEYSSGKMVSEIYQWKNASFNDWANVYKVNYAYDDSGNLVKQELLDDGGGAWYPVYSYEIEYDGDVPTTAISKYGNVEPIYKIDYTFNEHGQYTELLIYE